MKARRLAVTGEETHEPLTPWEREMTGQEPGSTLTRSGQATQADPREQG